MSPQDADESAQLLESTRAPALQQFQRPLPRPAQYCYSLVAALALITSACVVGHVALVMRVHGARLGLDGRVDAAELARGPALLLGLQRERAALTARRAAALDALVAGGALDEAALARSLPLASTWLWERVTRAPLGGDPPASCTGLRFTLDSSLLGPSTLAALAALSPLERWLGAEWRFGLLLGALAARGVEPRARLCPRYIEVAREVAGGGRLSADAGGGYEGAFACRAGDGHLVLRAEGNWGLKYSARKWCPPGGCFDARRPACCAAGPLRVFWYGADSGGARGTPPCLEARCAWLRDYALNSRSQSAALGSHGSQPARSSPTSSQPAIELVSDPDAACVFVFSPAKALASTRASADPTTARVAASWNWARDLPHWARAGGPGRNHVLVLAECMVHCDFVGTLSKFGGTGEAMFASASAWPGLFRPGHDLVLPPQVSPAIAELAAAWPAPFGGDRSSARPIFISFAGTTYRRNRWYDSRVVAAAFSHAPRDGLELFVFAKGGDKGRCVRPRTMPNRTYVETLARSDFGFAPGGTGPYTYRLMETLAAGAVPVVTLDMLLPFEGVLDEWERCVIRVSYAELRELRATLLLIAPPGSDAFRARLAACRALWEAHFVGGEPARRSADAYRNSTARTFWAELRARVDAAARSPRAAAGPSPMSFASLPYALALGLLWLNRAAPPPSEAAAPFGLPLAGVGGTPTEPSRPPPGAWLDASDFSIERWPRPSAAAAAAAAALRRAIEEGRLARAPDWKVAPRGYRVTLGHMAVCTSCWQRAYRRSLHAHPFAPALRAWQLLIDEHGVRAHRCAVRVAEPPTKTLLNLSCPGDCDDRGEAHAREVARAGQYGFYGSVLKLPDGRLHMWLGENQAWHASSSDGVRWSRPSPMPRTAAVAPANLCVSHDAARRRLLLGHDCGNIDGQQSACIATSSDADGLRWAPAGAQPRPVARADDCAAIGSCCCGGCESHADSTNCVRYDAAAQLYVLTKRQAFASARGRTAARLWREIRGVRFSTAADLVAPAAAQCAASTAGGGSARPAFTPRAEWYLDRSGKVERFERQLYALSVGDLPEAAASAKRSAAAARPAADALRVGVLTLLNWPKVNSTVELAHLHPPYGHDTVSAYLLPSRDGLTFDLDAVYANTPAIPHGGCEAGARGGLGANGAEGRCAPDHGYIQPATELLTHHGRHWLYYEARPLTHQHRWRVPAKIGVARWPLHRLTSVRADPRCAAPKARGGVDAAAAARACGDVLTRPFAMPADVRAVKVNARGGEPGGSQRGGLRVQLVREGAAALTLGFGPAARAATLYGDGPAARARAPGGGGLSALAGVQVQLRFQVCGDAALFAWRLE